MMKSSGWELDSVQKIVRKGLSCRTLNFPHSAKKFKGTPMRVSICYPPLAGVIVLRCLWMN